MSDSDQDPKILESDNPLKAIAVVELEIDEPDPEIKEECARNFLEQNLIEYAGENSIENNSIIEKPVIKKIVSGGESCECEMCWGSGRVPGHKLPKADKNADYPCPECNREELQEYFPEIVQAYSDEPSGESGSTALQGGPEPDAWSFLYWYHPSGDLDTRKVHLEHPSEIFRRDQYDGESPEPLFSVSTITEYFEIKELINQLAIAHRHMDEHDIQGEARESNERLQRKLEEVFSP